MTNSLRGQRIPGTFNRFLQSPEGFDGTPRQVRDGEGNTLPLRVSTGAVEVTAEPTTAQGVASKNYVDTRFVSSVAALRSLSASDYTSPGSIGTKGYRTGSTEGAGFFVWDEDATEADNGGTIIQPTGVATGRLKRVVPNGVLTPEMFGAVGDMVNPTDPGTDDAAAFANMFTFAQSARTFAVELGAKSYHINGQSMPNIQVPLRVRGGGRGLCKLFAGDDYEGPLMPIDGTGGLLPQWETDGGAGYLGDFEMLGSRRKRNGSLRPFGVQHGLAMMSRVDNWVVRDIGILNFRGWGWVAGLKGALASAWLRELHMQGIEVRDCGAGVAFAAIEWIVDNTTYESFNNLDMFFIQSVFPAGAGIRISGRAPQKRPGHNRFSGFQMHGDTRDALAVEIAEDPRTAFAGDVAQMHFDCDGNFDFEAIKLNAARQDQWNVHLLFSPHKFVTLDENAVETTDELATIRVTLPAPTTWSITGAALRTIKGSPYVEIDFAGAHSLALHDALTLDTFTGTARTAVNIVINGLTLRDDMRVVDVISATTVAVQPFRGGFATATGAGDSGANYTLIKSYDLRTNGSLSFNTPRGELMAAETTVLNSVPLRGIWRVNTQELANRWVMRKNGTPPAATATGTHAGALTAWLSAGVKGPRVRLEGAGLGTKSNGVRVDACESADIELDLNITNADQKVLQVGPTDPAARCLVRGPVNHGRGWRPVPTRNTAARVSIHPDARGLVNGPQRAADVWLPTRTAGLAVGTDRLNRALEYALTGAIFAAERRLTTNASATANNLNDLPLTSRGVFSYSIRVQASQIAAPSAGVLDDGAHWAEIMAYVRWDGTNAPVLTSVTVGGSTSTVTEGSTAAIAPAVHTGSVADGCRVRIAADTELPGLAVFGTGITGATYSFTARVLQIGSGSGLLTAAAPEDEEEETEIALPSEDYAEFSDAVRPALLAMDTAPSLAWAELYQATIDALATAGVLAKMSGLYLLAAHSEQAARLNFVAPGTADLTTSGTPVFTVGRGYEGDGAAAYLTTGRAPNATPGFAQDDAHMGSYFSTDAAPAVGIGLLNGLASSVFNRTAGGNVEVRANTTTINGVVAVASAVGHVGWSRSNSSEFVRYIDGVGVTVANTSTALSANAVTLLRSTVANYSAGGAILSAAHLGASLDATEMAAVRDILAAHVAAAATL